MRVYLDASFLVSLYSVDANSVAAARMLQGVDAMLLVSSLAELEVVNAFELRVFRKEITSFESKHHCRVLARICSQASFKRAPFRLLRLPADAGVPAKHGPAWNAHIRSVACCGGD